MHAPDALFDGAIAKEGIGAEGERDRIAGSNVWRIFDFQILQVLQNRLIPLCRQGRQGRVA